MKKLTRTEARKASKWFLARMGMDDWAWGISLSDRRPDWVAEEFGDALGFCRATPRNKYARIWVSQSNCDAADDDALTVLMHEFGHALLADVSDGEPTEATQREEYMLDRLCEVWAFAYRRGMKP